jgi:hypothetical protein
MVLAHDHVGHLVRGGLPAHLPGLAAEAARRPEGDAPHPCGLVCAGLRVEHHEDGRVDRPPVGARAVLALALHEDRMRVVRDDRRRDARLEVYAASGHRTGLRFWVFGGTAAGGAFDSNADGNRPSGRLWTLLAVRGRDQRFRDSGPRESSSGRGCPRLRIRRLGVRVPPSAQGQRLGSDHMTGCSQPSDCNRDSNAHRAPLSRSAATIPSIASAASRGTSSSA